jgi:hypothetical protein
VRAGALAHEPGPQYVVSDADVYLSDWNIEYHHDQAAVFVAPPPPPPTITSM